MDRTEVLQGLRKMRFEKLLECWQRSDLSQAEAAEALGMSERSFRRWHTRWLEEGEAGLHDRRRRLRCADCSGRRIASQSMLPKLKRLPPERVNNFETQLAFNR